MTETLKNNYESERFGDLNGFAALEGMKFDKSAAEAAVKEAREEMEGGVFGRYQG